MSYKVKVRYINQSNEIATYFFSRAIRSMTNGIPGVNISGNVFPLYSGNFIDINELEDKKLKVNECPLMPEKEAIEKMKFLPSPFFSDLAIQENKEIVNQQQEISDYGQEKKKPLNEVLNQKKEKIDNKRPDKRLLDHEHVEEKFKNFIDSNPITVLPINYSDVPGFSFPQYEKDWFFERSVYYSYITVNESEDRIDHIKTILRSPSEYACIDVGWGRGRAEPIHKDDGEIEFSDEMTVYLPPKPINESIDSAKETFMDRYGEFEFECKRSYRAAPNNVQYDYWFRFDLSISDDLLKNMFEDILRVSEAAKILSLETFSHNKYKEFEKDQEIITDNQSQYNELEELANLYAADNDELKQSLDKAIESNKRIEELNSSLKKNNEILKDKIAKLERKELANFERNLETFLPNFDFLERGMKSVKRDYQSTKKLQEVLHLVHEKSKNIGFKKVQNTKYWQEVDKKFSNGVDNQGRIYFCKQELKTYILIGHKQNQDEDFVYLQKNDPPIDLDK